MMDRLNETDYKPNPVLARALDVLFILHADHELNCSTAAMRHLSSTKVDPYTAMAGAAGALYGPLHGGAVRIYPQTGRRGTDVVFSFFFLQLTQLLVIYWFGL